MSKCILQDESIVAKEGKSALEARYEVACNRLASEAVRRLSQDNVTVLLIRIDTPSVWSDWVETH